jgi:hypothetical protein
MFRSEASWRNVLDWAPPGSGSAGGTHTPMPGGPTVGWPLANRSGYSVANRKVP